MANFQYKTASAGTWTDVPRAAMEGTFSGTLDVVYPLAEERDGQGRWCASAVGQKQVLLRSQMMTASGMHFWRGRFATATAVDVEFWLTARDSRGDPAAAIWKKYTGWLAWPKWGRVQVGSGSLSTLYFDVELVLDDARETS